MKILATLQGKMIHVVSLGASFMGKLIDFDDQLMHIEIANSGNVYIGIANVGYIGELVTKAS